MDELFWIQQLCSKNLADAKKAWKVLEPNIRNYLLQNPCPSYIEREDVISKSMVKIWRARAKWCELEEPKFESEAAWKSYVRAVGMNTLRDEISAFQRNELEREVAIAEVTKDSVEPSWPFEHSVCDYADAFWLKSDLKLSPIERAQRVLAAQFFYLHGESWQNVLSVISKRFNAVIDRRTLDIWLEDQATLNKMAFKEMHVSGYRLCQCLLNPEGGVGLERIAEILRTDKPGNDHCPGTIWTYLEAKIIVLRYGNGLKEEGIRSQCRQATDEKIQEVVSRVAVLLPFKANGKKLKGVFPHQIEFPLSKAEFWRRVAYEYREIEDLPFKQIEERMIGAAAEAGYSLNEKMLTTWLSGGRLVEALGKFIVAYYKKHGGKAHE